MRMMLWLKNKWYYGISFEKETGEKEEAADKFAENSLIPGEQYQKFVEQARFDLQSIKDFAKFKKEGKDK